MELLAYIIMVSIEYEGMYPYSGTGSDHDPLPTFTSRENAEAFCRKKKLASRSHEILAIRLTA